VQNCRIFVRVK